MTLLMLNLQMGAPMIGTSMPNERVTITREYTKRPDKSFVCIRALCRWHLTHDRFLLVAVFRIHRFFQEFRRPDISFSAKLLVTDKKDIHQ